MKLVIAIVNADDVNTVVLNLTRNGFSATRMPTTGGFLMAKNVTVLVGVDEEKVQAVIDIIKEHSHSRKQGIPASSGSGMGYAFQSSIPLEVNVGGATIFVVDVEQFLRV